MERMPSGGRSGLASHGITRVRFPRSRTVHNYPLLLLKPARAPPPCHRSAPPCGRGIVRPLIPRGGTHFAQEARSPAGSGSQKAEIMGPAGANQQNLA
jgi:hypothetical protein